MIRLILFLIFVRYLSGFKPKQVQNNHLNTMMNARILSIQDMAHLQDRIRENNYVSDALLLNLTPFIIDGIVYGYLKEEFMSRYNNGLI